MLTCTSCGTDIPEKSIANCTHVYNGRPYCSARCAERLYEVGEEQFELALEGAH